MSLFHVSGPRIGETDTIGRTPAVIGCEEGADVIIPGVAPRHAVILRRDHDVFLRDGGSGLGTYLAGQAVEEATLRDGDVVELGIGGPQLRFRREGKPGRLLPKGAPAGLLAFLGRTSRSFRIALVASLGAAMLFVAWSQWETYRLQREVARLREAVRRSEEDRRRFQERVEQERQRSEADRGRLERELAETRQRAENLSRRLAEAASGEVQGLRGELDVTRQRLETLESERAAGERIIREFGAGVCLIQGSYAFYDGAGRPLRYRLNESGEPAKDGEGSFRLDVEGRGAVHTADYFGTGFLAAGSGLVLTNRHVAEPWWNDNAAQALERTGFHPRFVLFRAFFPLEKEPFELAIERVAENVDVALLKIDTRRARIPILPLERADKGAVPGQPVVVVGYPTGLEAILAKADSKLVQEILAEHGTSSERVTEVLSRKGLIRPSTTQGHIGDVTRTDIVFDAPTSQGGSGGPVFNKNGRVVAVEYAILSKFGGNSFGVPIRYALDLLGGRKQPRGD